MRYAEKILANIKGALAYGFDNNAKEYFVQVKQGTDVNSIPTYIGLFPVKIQVYDREEWIKQITWTTSSL